uniref:glycosyltransferase family protein n=1 Tax=Prevotella sp. TaxID=59823 RepID=UPI0040258902
MKIVLITHTTPASDNIRGTSALPYHLMIERDKNVNIDIFTYNINHLSKEKIEEVERELNVHIYLVKQQKWLRWMMRLHLLVLRIFLRLPYLSYLRLPKSVRDEIVAMNPDGIWVYGEELAPMMSEFPQFRRVHIGPDSEALYYYRMLGQKFVVNSQKSYWRQAIMYPKYLCLERNYLADENAIYCVVGDADKRFVERMNPACHALFIRHPHYNFVANRIIRFSHPKIKILIAGQYNLYMRSSFDALLPVLCAHNELSTDYTITFLGKGWDDVVEKLCTAGYESERLGFVDVYLDEISKYDVQITPITIGTGTKGKVLDALANGLLVIGTPYALENIAVENEKSCIEYNDPEEVIDTLKDMAVNRTKYEEMAAAGRRAVLTEHGRSKQAAEFFGLFSKRMS